MLKALLISSLFFSVTLAETSNPFIWPAPSSFSSGTETLVVDASCALFETKSSPVPNTLLAAFKRYCDITFPHVAGGATANIKKLVMSWEDGDESHPQLETDESYTLAVPTGTAEAKLSAKTIYGIMRGLETFSQLVVFDFGTKSYRIHGGPWEITDSPRFPHRGLMIDSARHFETLASIRHVIDALPYAKLNVLHWHMVDTQSFPFESKKFPKLWDGAYSEFEKFTQEDIAVIVEYARMRGVRVIVEFDVPGHAASWCKGYPEICPSKTCLQPLNVANNFTFELYDGLLSECTGGHSSSKGKASGLFPDHFIHLGGDEVDTKCWTSTPEVASWLKDNGMTADQGYAYFVKKVAAMAIKQGRRPIQWSEVFDHFKTELPKDVIVHIWKSVTNITEVVADGYNVLLNVGYDANSWYLDNLNVNWTAVYLNEPCATVPDDLCPMILGGHGEMWGETVDTSDIEETVWPRLAAIAERLWSPRSSIGNISDAHARIEYFRCLLNRRGVAAAPVNNPNARMAPPGPGSCFDQRRR
jgi:hexosaminidase